MPDCTCSHLDGVRLARQPHAGRHAPGCDQHPPEICAATAVYVRSSWTGEPVGTPCNTRLVGGQCPNKARHERAYPRAVAASPG